MLRRTAGAGAGCVGRLYACQKVLISTDMISNLRLINLNFGYRPGFCKRLSSCILRSFNRHAAKRLAVLLIEREAARA
jgi:hypothetical protein